MSTEQTKLKPIDSPLADLLVEAGARFAGSQRAAPLDYGDPAAEERAAQEGAVLFERSHAGRLRVTGPDAAAFLHRVCTQDVQGLSVGEGAPAALTDHKARFVTAGVLQRLEEESFVWLLDPGALEPARDWLERYALMDEVAVGQEETAEIVLAGPTASRKSLLGTDPAVLEDAARHHVRTGGGPEGEELRVSLGWPMAGPTFRLIGPPEAIRSTWRACREQGAVPGGETLWEALRIEAGLFRHGREIVPEANPWEAGLERAVSLEKGCYTGQETLNRLRTYGGVRRRLRRLGLQEGDLPEPGAELERDGEQVGGVTSAARLPADGRGVALGYLEDSAAEEGTSLRCGEAVLEVLGPPLC